MIHLRRRELVVLLSGAAPVCWFACGAAFGFAGGKVAVLDGADLRCTGFGGTTLGVVVLEVATLEVVGLVFVALVFVSLTGGVFGGLVLGD